MAWEEALFQESATGAGAGQCMLGGARWQAEHGPDARLWPDWPSVAGQPRTCEYPVGTWSKTGLASP